MGSLEDRLRRLCVARAWRVWLVPTLRQHIFARSVHRTTVRMPPTTYSACALIITCSLIIAALWSLRTYR